MRSILNSYVPDQFVNKIDLLVKHLPHPLKALYHNLPKYAPRVESTIPITYRIKGRRNSDLSAQFFQHTKRMDMSVATRRLFCAIEYHLKANHQCLISVDYLSEQEIETLQQMATQQKCNSLAIKANEVPTFFYSKNNADNIFNLFDLILITGPVEDKLQNKTGTQFLNDRVVNDLAMGERTLIVITETAYDLSVNLSHVFDCTYKKIDSSQPKTQPG